MKGHAFGEHKINWLDKLIARLRYRRLGAYLTASASLLDVGCGYHASFLSWAERKFGLRELAGIDMSISDQLLSDRRYDLKRGDLNAALPWADASRTLVTSAAVLEHLTNPAGNLKEIYRILQPGGRLVLTTPAPAARRLLELLAFRLHAIDAAEIRDHQRYFSQADLREILRGAGFSSDKIMTKSFLFGFNNLAVCLK